MGIYTMIRLHIWSHSTCWYLSESTLTGSSRTALSLSPNVHHAVSVHTFAVAFAVDTSPRLLARREVSPVTKKALRRDTHSHM